MIEVSFVPDRKVLADGVYEAIKESIVDQLIVPGTRINIEELARRLRVSATPVREALARLEAERLVRKEALKGYTAAPVLDKIGFERLYEMRRLIEPFAAEMAAARATAADRRAIEAAFEETKTAQTGLSYREYRAFTTADVKYHKVIAEASYNPFLQDAMERLRAHSQSSRVYLRHRHGAKFSIPEHFAILAAIRNGDPISANKAAKVHVDHSFDRLRQVLSEMADGNGNPSPDPPELGSLT